DVAAPSHPGQGVGPHGQDEGQDRERERGALAGPGDEEGFPAHGPDVLVELGWFGLGICCIRSTSRRICSTIALARSRSSAVMPSPRFRWTARDSAFSAEIVVSTTT